MRVSASDPVVKKTDVNGSEVFTVKLESAVLWDTQEHKDMAVLSLEKFLKTPVTTVKTMPIYTTTGMTIAYAIWVEEVK
jgi:hypothetical protein